MAVCGPTAVGKSALADDLADDIGASTGAPTGAPTGARTPVVVVDSMQVYEGVAEITNQARRRPAELVGVVPVSERWTVALHREAAEAIISAQDAGVVLDAGTGMYLNAILFDLALAPEVPEGVRREAARATAREENPRRAARDLELRMVGADDRGSIWEGSLGHDTTLVYLRPERHVMDSAIARRTAGIVERGMGEAERLKSMRDRGEQINPSVLDAVGVRELLARVDGELDADRCREAIETRTRRLARRQVRWFDKLARTLHGRTDVVIVEDAADRRIWHTMHGRIGT